MRDVERLRAQNAALLAAERGARVLDAERDRAPLLQRLLSERPEVQRRLATAAGLETLRLDLLRADEETSGTNGLTTHLEAVRELARQLDAAAEVRAYLARSNPTPASVRCWPHRRLGKLRHSHPRAPHAHQFIRHSQRCGWRPRKHSAVPHG